MAGYEDELNDLLVVSDKFTGDLKNAIDRTEKEIYREIGDCDFFEDPEIPPPFTFIDTARLLGIASRVTGRKIRYSTYRSWVTIHGFPKPLLRVADGDGMTGQYPAIFISFIRDFFIKRETGKKIGEAVSETLKDYERLYVNILLNYVYKYIHIVSGTSIEETMRETQKEIISIVESGVSPNPYNVKWKIDLLSIMEKWMKEHSEQIGEIFPLEVKVSLRYLMGAVGDWIRSCLALVESFSTDAELLSECSGKALLLKGENKMGEIYKLYSFAESLEGWLKK